MFVPISCHRTSKPLGISCVSVMLMRWCKVAPRTLGSMLVTRKMDCMTWWGLWDSPTPGELRGLEVELSALSARQCAPRGCPQQLKIFCQMLLLQVPESFLSNIPWLYRCFSSFQVFLPPGNSFWNFNMSVSLKATP